MTDRIAQIIADVIKREGGLVDDPTDRGGITNHGVSLRYAKGIGLDLDGDQDTDADDVKLVTPEVAAELYLRDFYRTPKIDTLPAELRPQLVDCAVHHGAPRAVLFLQEVLVEAGFGPLDLDGRVGGMTRKAAEVAQSQMGSLLNDAVADQRAAFMKAIVARDPTQRRSLDGWLRRAAVFRTTEPPWLPERFKSRALVSVPVPEMRPVAETPVETAPAPAKLWLIRLLELITAGLTGAVATIGLSQ